LEKEEGQRNVDNNVSNTTDINSEKSIGESFFRLLFSPKLFISFESVIFSILIWTVSFFSFIKDT
jgi:hypothetical protein